ncbi:hypothetical protein [Haematobacter missouriensis]|uniref:hypothetical protein n=1 Tax=Haematobacter missouriensis TaxID=366616 RepID=UPI00117A59F6|nr:hypothetical protein [Haematobacter missouriensis]
MWLPLNGVPLEDAYRILRRYITRRAVEELISRNPPIDLTFPFSERTNFEAKSHLDFNARLGALSLLRDMMKRSKSPIVFATSSQGQKVGLSWTSACYMSGWPAREKTKLDKNGERVTVPGETPPAILAFWAGIGLSSVNARRIDTVDLFSTTVWVDAFIKGEVFEASEREHIASPNPERLIDIRNGVVDLSPLRAVESAYRLASEGRSRLASALVPTYSWNRYPRDLPRIQATLKAYEPIEGWRVHVEGSLEPSTYLSLPSLEEDAQIAPPPNKPGRPKKGGGLVELAISNEFSRRVQNGEITRRDKRESICADAQQWARNILGQDIGRATAQRYLSTAFDLLDAQY